MNESAIVTPRDLDAAIRAHQSRRWDELWADARRPRFGRDGWTFLVLAVFIVLLQGAILIGHEPSRARFMESLAGMGLLLQLPLVLFAFYVRRKTRQVNALRALLHGVLTESVPFSAGALEEGNRR